jgi:Glycosyltransferase family 25 (LPS biosynthesis protein)
MPWRMARENDVAKRLQSIPAANDGLAPLRPTVIHAPPPVVITLDRRPDRCEKVVCELARIGISRDCKFSAVDGATLSAHALARFVDSDRLIRDLPTSHTQLTRPAIGCFLGHLQIWQAFVASGNDGNERIVILEDGAVPAPAYSAAATASFRVDSAAGGSGLARLQHHGRLGRKNTAAVSVAGLLFQRHVGHEPKRLFAPRAASVAAACTHRPPDQ